MPECLLRCSWVVHPTHGLRAGETLPMRKPATGEPCAGEPHARFGGRGGPTPFPTPIDRTLDARHCDFSFIQGGSATRGRCELAMIGKLPFTSDASRPHA